VIWTSHRGDEDWDGLVLNVKMIPVEMIEIQGTTQMRLPIEWWNSAKDNMKSFGLIQGSQLSWNLKFPEILLIWQECPENGFWCAITCCSFLFYWLFLHYAVVGLFAFDNYRSLGLLLGYVDCPVVLLTVFMTALFSSDLHKWFLLKKNVCIYCVYLAACGRKMSLNCPEI